MFEFPISYLNSNDGTAILAFGEGPVLSVRDGAVMTTIQNFIDKYSEQYVFFGLSYDLKNDIEALQSKNTNRIDFPKALLWVPKYVVRINNGAVNFLYGDKNIESSAFVSSFVSEQNKQDFPPLNIAFKARTEVDDYLNNVNLLKEEIQQGNIYEVNYCQEYFAENVELKDPLNAYFKLNQITKAPYSTFFKINEFTILSGSPESFIRKKGRRIVSSPIKGTRKRGESIEEDEHLKVELENDQKERSENIMIVDLVRNDLSKIATKGSVQVDELLKIYSFETVHQMISTISCDVEPSVSFADVLKATYPMGSMTGAPKISAMNLIEKHEDFQRGIYSGSIGYIAPNGDFDLNVIIRTLIYNSDRKYISCPVGGAITVKSEAESEYEECLVKVKGILDQMNA